MYRLRNRSDEVEREKEIWRRARGDRVHLGVQKRK